MDKTISIIIPAFNEEGNLQATVETVVRIISGRFSDYEILIFNDFSTDKTGIIADELASKNPKIKVIHNETNMGFGYNYTKGVELASMQYAMMVPGDNEITESSIEVIMDAAGQADIIIPYTVNMEVRPLSRRVLSRAFTKLMNLITGLNLRYYNGPCLHRSEIIKKVPMTTWGYAYMAAILARLIRSGRTYKEVGMHIKERAYGGSSALKLKNVFRVSKTLWELFLEFRVK